jgi:serine/threonine protein kinase
LERLKKSDPDSIGPWKLISRLGSGGMSVVYLASKSNKTSVALKVIRSQYLDNQADRNRIEREISTLTNIKSKYVCQILDSDISEDYAWIATEFIDGPDLKTLVLEDGPFDENSWYELAKGLLEGLSAIHENKVIHRDIKPSNILISDSGPKIIDFGIAQTSEATSLTSTGLIAGSPAWLSPEQINGDKVTYSSDFFSAGAVLNFAVSGISPWGDNTKITKDVIYNRILQKQPDLSSLNILQKSLVEKMMQKDPKSRPSADQALIYLNDKWSQEAKIKKQLEEEERRIEKEEKQKREELSANRAKNRQRLKKVFLQPLFLRRKIISLALASIFILSTTGTYAFNSYSSKSGIFQFLNESTLIKNELPEKIIAQPQPSISGTGVPETTQSPMPSPSATNTVPVTVEEKTTTSKNVLQICREVREMIATNNGVEQKNTKSCWPESVKSKMGPCVLEDREYWAAGQLVKNGVGIESVNIAYSHAGKDKSIKCETLPLPYTPGGPNVTGYRATEFLPNYFEKATSIESVNWTISGGINMTAIDTFEIKEVKSTSPSKNVSTTPNIVGSNIDLNKTKICLTIFQHGTSDNYCYKDTPRLRQPDYSSHQGITPFAEDKFLFLYVPWEKSAILGCTRSSYTVNGQSYLNGELFFNDWMTGTFNRNLADLSTNKFCEKFGGFDYQVYFDSPYGNTPYFRVVPYDKKKVLPQSYELIQDYGDYKINYIFTWQKR